MPTLRTTPIQEGKPVPEPDNIRGLMLMSAGFFAFAACDVQAKVLAEHLHPAQVVWFRQFGLFVGVVILLALKGPHILRSRLPFLQIARGLTAIGSAVFFVLAVRHVPLADATAVTFIAPFLVTLLGAIVLREPVGPRRWAAVAVGFVGMLVVIRPGMGVFHPAILFIVVAALFFSTRQVLSRSLAGLDSVPTTVAYTSITATLILSVTLPFVWQNLTSPTLWAVAVGLAVTAGLGEVLVIRALDIAQASVVAPMQYSLIIWSTFYGFVVFGDLPDGWTFVGCAIIVASGLYTLHRERLNARAKRQSAAAGSASHEPAQ